jgi:hypothetical protein
VRPSNLLAGAALLAALAAACKPAPPAPEPDPTGGVALTAPSSSTIASPLGPSSGTFTNEMQAQVLRDQAAELGISRLAKPSVQSGDSDEPTRTITYQEGVQRTREMARDAEAERRAIEGDKNKSVAIPTDTAGLVPKKGAGEPIESAGGQ